MSLYEKIMLYSSVEDRCNYERIYIYKKTKAKLQDGNLIDLLWQYFLVTHKKNTNIGCV